MKWKHDYTEKGFIKFIKDGAECFWHSWIKHRVLVCDMIADYDLMQHKEYCIREEYWTDDKKSMLHERGYRICEGLPGHDNLAWMGTPVMMKLYGFKTIEEISKDNPSFLNDRMQNNLLNKFAKSLASAAALAGMDVQKILVMVGLGIAAVVGMKLFGVF
jgi:hypothetical protein